MVLVISVSQVIINHLSLVEMGYFQGIGSFSKIDQVWESISVVVIEILLSKLIQNYISRLISVNVLPTIDSSYQDNCPQTLGDTEQSLQTFTECMKSLSSTMKNKPKEALKNLNDYITL